MAGADYLTEYKLFFTEFAATVNPEDQLPVKLGGYCLCEPELTGEIVDWILQYLDQKRCPSSLIAPLTKIVVDDTRMAIKKHPAAYGYRREDNTYQPLKLMQVVTAKVNEVCLSFLDQPLTSFPPPTSCCLPMSACAVKNTRRRMEDRHTIIADYHSVFDVVGGGRATYYGVFDGHAGTDAAVYSASHLHQFLAESVHYPSDPIQAMREAFLKTDSFFLEKSTRDNLHSGTTALCALLRHDERMLYVGWVGDSQALLVTRGQAEQLVKSHKPERADERKRIEDSGGCVMFWGLWRVNGQLAVSRAIGDLEYKPWVSAEPDIVSMPLTDDRDFLILACDGLWDFVSEREAVVSVYNTIRQHPGDLEAVSQSLVQLSKEQGSLDNISVIVVFLTDPAVLASLDVWPTCESDVEDTMEDTIEVHTNGSSEPSYQKANLLLDLDGGGGADKLKQAAASSPSATDLYFLNRPANGKEDDDDDFGPETDVDGVDDVLLSPAIAAAKAAALASDLEADLELQRQQTSAFDHVGEQREETPTPPADGVSGGASLVAETENVAESGEESEDEWNYYRVEPTEKTVELIADPSEPIADPSKLLDISVDISLPSEEDDNMESRLNPNAAEFVPSPTGLMPSMEEMLSSMSPCKAGVSMDDIRVPTPIEFQVEVSQRPADGIDNVGCNQFGDESFNTSFSDFGVTQLDEKNPYQLLKNEPEFGELPGPQNPFIDGLYSDSEVLSADAKFDDDTANTNILDVAASSFMDRDPLNSSMVESALIATGATDVSNNSTDFFGFENSQMAENLQKMMLPSEPNLSGASENNFFDITASSDYMKNFSSSDQDTTVPLSPTDPSSPIAAPAPMDDLNILLLANEVTANISFEQEVNFAPAPHSEEMNVFDEFESKVMAPFTDLVQDVAITSGIQHLDLQEFSDQSTLSVFEHGFSSNTELIPESVDLAVCAPATPEPIIHSENSAESTYVQVVPDITKEAIAEPVKETSQETSVETSSIGLETLAIGAVASAAVATAAVAAVKNAKADVVAKSQEKKPAVDKTKTATKPIPGNRSAPLKPAVKSTPSSPTKPLSSVAPQAAPRSTPVKKTPATTSNRVTAKPSPTATKVGPTATAASKVTVSVTQARKVTTTTPTRPSAAAAAATKPTAAKTATTVVRPRPTATAKPLATEKKPALSNGDAKLPAKRLEPLVTKKLIPATTTSKPLARPASAPVAAKTTKTSTVTRTTNMSTAAPLKPGAKPAVNGVSKLKTTTSTTVTARPKTASAVTKVALVDKQGKETANKQLSQTVKSSTITRTTTTSTVTARKLGGNATKTTSVTTTNSKGPIRRPTSTTVTKTTTTTQIEDGPIENKVVGIQEITSSVSKDDSPIVDNAHSEELVSMD